MDKAMLRGFTHELTLTLLSCQCADHIVTSQVILALLLLRIEWLS